MSNRTKVVRKKLAVKKKASVKNISPSKELVVVVNSGSPIDVSWMAAVPNAVELVRELNIYVRGNRGGRSTVNEILKYFKYLVDHGLEVNGKSVNRYRAFLDRKKSIGSNTKSQRFGATVSFLKSAMAAGVLDEERLPKNFRKGLTTAKASFSDLCRSEVKALSEDAESDSASIVKTRGLDEEQAASLSFSETSMSLIRAYSEARVSQTVSDWEFVFSLTEKISKKQVSKLRKLDFRKTEDKTVDLAVSILYAHFGYAIPRTVDWPPGICDWCRKGPGWLSSRVSAAFFPNVKSLDAFLVLMLSEGSLALNVDSAAMYSYIDSYKFSSDDKLVDAYFGKPRGKALNATLRNDNPVAEAMIALATKLKQTLPLMPGGKKKLRTGNVPLFTHWTSFCGQERELRGLDSSTTSRMVRRCFREASKIYPDLSPLADKATGENFRPTHVLIKSLNGESTGKINRDLNHKNLSTTGGYVDRVDTQAVLKNKRERFQVYIIEQAMNERRTGSGYLCSKPISDGCVSHSECRTCDAKRIVLQTPEIVAEWITFEKHICDHETRLSVNNPERWRKYWLPRLEEYRVLIALTDEKIKHEAEELVDEVVLPWLS